MKLVFALVLLCLALVNATQFNGNPVVLVRIDNEQEFQKFAQKFPVESIDMWSETYAAKTDMEIRFTPKQMSETSGIKFTKFQVMIKDLQKLLNAEVAQMKQHNAELEKKMKNLKTKEQRDELRFSDDEWFKSYHTYDEIRAYVAKLLADYPSMTDRETIGQTIEGRPTDVIRIHAPGAYDPTKPSLYIQSLMHAREWVSGPTTQYFAKKLLSTYATDNRVKRILDNLNVHWVPIVNSDGFIFTHTNNRMWRKNRKRNPDGSYGVDLNRNWLSGFGGPGSSGSPRSDTYRGTAAYSEPETKAVNDYITKYGREFKGAIDYHAYSQLNLRPWGKIRTVSPDEAKLRDLGAKMMAALRSVHGQTYRNIRAAELYQAGGLASDTWYESHKLIGYTYELRPSSAWGGGFALPANQILPCAQENYPATLVMAEYIIDEAKKNNKSGGDKVLEDLLKQF